MCVAPRAHVREHSGKSRLAEHPTRGCAAVRRGARPSRVHDASRRCRHALGRKRPKASLSRPQPGPLQQRLRRWAGWACTLPCAYCSMGCLGRHAGLLDVIGTCATAFGVGMCACTRSAVVWSVSRTEGRSAFAATRWQECPTWSRATPGARKPGLATGLTAGSSTHRVPAHTLLSRSKHCYHE